MVLSGSVQLDARMLQDNLEGLAQVSSIPVFIGGHVAEDYRDEIEAAGAVPLPEDLFATFRIINSVLPITPTR